MYLAVSWVLLCVGVVTYILGGFLMVSGWLVVVVGLGALGLRFLVLCLYGGFSCGWPMVWVCFFLGLCLGGVLQRCFGLVCLVGFGCTWRFPRVLVLCGLLWRTFSGGFVGCLIWCFA